MDCPFRVVPDRVLRVLPFYADWDKGRLPADGGILDQPASFIDAMRVLDAQIASIQKRDQESASSESTTSLARIQGM